MTDQTIVYDHESPDLKRFHAESPAVGPAPAPAPTLPVSNNDSQDASPDVTLDYDDDDDDKKHDACWTDSSNISCYEIRDDHFHYAIDDAKYIRQCQELEADGGMPWSKEESFFVIPGPFTYERCFFYDFVEDRCYSVSSDELLTEKDVIANWPAVEKADREEVRSFIHHDVFRVDLRENATNIVDGVWVRKWKDRKKGIVKSRCCGRGYLDRQKTVIDRHSSTASRLSHRVAVCLATQFDLCMECFDISTAFLQGLRFSEVAAASRALGHEARTPRAVWFKPPPNVWRHAREAPGSPVRVMNEDIGLFVLRCLKALYGLVDGPLMWQIALLTYLKGSLGFTSSLHDENFLFKVSGYTVTAICTVHVDDLFIASAPSVLDHLSKQIELKFGNPKRHGMPFTYLGIVHERLGPFHVLLHQEPYLQKLKAAASTKDMSKVADGIPLDAHEHREFRSLLCSLLWVCQTRIDIAHDVVGLQSEMTAPKAEHWRSVNALLKRARSNSVMNGLHFRKLTFPIRIVSIADCGHATKKSCYPYEGKMVVIMADRTSEISEDEWMHSSSFPLLEGHAHPIFFSARKATRISHSTSHAETLSAVGCTQTAQLVSHRFTEVFAQTILQRSHYTPTDLLMLQHENMSILPIDHVTDCMDLFELMCSAKGMASDKSQRVAVLALREDRMSGRLRFIMHWPTLAMLADGLTKSGLFLQLMRYCTTGFIGIPLKAEQYIRLRRRVGRDAYSERDLENLDW